MNKGRKVKPRYIKDIRDLSHLIRQEFDLPKAWFPIVELVEKLAANEAIEFMILAENEMPHDYGLTFPRKNLIQIREDVYEDAVSKGGFGRFTMAHELGHLFLHRNEPAFARNQSVTKHQTIEDSEWQANKFAQELLVDVRHLDPYSTPELMAKKFGITGQAAQVTFNALKREGILR
ncbi:MAG TPA: ImmA/IrrE family metallo-endopeptidase [Candidatus Thiothrix moscowensis]|uniref:ImmA/IrrE family metallo-endopeptidase n=1 Tax=Thiothrix fructosivorans TaxID=111770 RepID=A0A8B0SNM4_9GAMM|nr:MULTISPECIES: ImmA/IrrE family metallo-endopeptidase [Thiothrix]MBO0612909.1 ImmA/IrrE family metallo-endopeptidase [Thiothrix fructosivorans]QTX11638.1 ImmA/IrrE family metallo-endopeptidase [Thiothrix fructosivorans]HRJ51939.1 ImmA/IrrE family metallo-endopeptidase [Candidatus Thiothrix moscowensis]HRJ92254.1 ImmA/IrrE family metallo-endopeptidase [Candidatus Thiothrix moscowensis]